MKPSVQVETAFASTSQQAATDANRLTRGQAADSPSTVRDEHGRYPSSGRRIRLRGRGLPNPRGRPGDLYVIPRGVEHCPRSDEGVEVMLIEPTGTVNTGETGGELTAVKERI